ncbi:MAG TPA: M61 family peptidase [Thermoanaerobaculia bacterium]|nr:M61 family peptidase [Thermoanaerobaculia bacterium]
MPSRRAFPRFTWIAVLLAMASAAWGAAPRPIELTVDATDAPRGVFHSRLVIPAAPGVLTLAYPKWVQGEHAPSGPIQQVAGFTVSAGGKALPWRRDPLDPFLVRVEVPAGAGAVEVALDYLSPTESYGAGYGKTPNATPHLVIVDWHDLLVYLQGPPGPSGATAMEIPVQATLRLPAGWQLDTALAVTGKKDGAVTFAPVSLYTLLDSPVLSGEIFRTVEVGPREVISIAADRRTALDVPEARIAAWRRMPVEAEALFGARHYGSYHWLVALGDTLEQNGLEHHESSDNRGRLGMFSDEPLLIRNAALLAHEYVHSWNGKYRRPAGLATRDPQETLQTELLWVYEGMTRYLGELVLTTRSGIFSQELTREYLAWVAANQDRNRPGRRWRPLADTAASSPVLSGAPQAWTAWRRALDYYDESALIWLEADTLLRAKSGGAKSLDDFCRAFFGGSSTPPAVVPYTADDAYAALGGVVPYDWRGFFAERVYAVQPRAPLGGLEAAGWKLVYTDRPNVYQVARAKSSGLVDESFSLGLWMKEDGTIADIVVGSPAWDAGLGPGMKLVAVNGRKWAPEMISQEVQTASRSTTAIEITTEHGDMLRTFKVSYQGGERYPHLERDTARPDLLSAILAPKSH